jgi:hypothetical protein
VKKSQLTACAHLTTAPILTVCFLLATTAASGAAIGSLVIGTPGTVTVTATTIDWNAGAGGFDFSVNPTTTLTFDAANTPLCSGAPCAAATEGNLANLTAGTLPVPGFMTFLNNAQPTASDLMFMLTGIGPGSPNTDCSLAAVTSGLETCSINALSPFILADSISGVSIVLDVNGTATDNTPTVSNWMGQFSETITSCPVGVCTGGTPTAAEIQNFFLTNPNASITSSFSGTFIATVTPEPSSVLTLMLGGSLILLALVRRPARR